jgi:hypothetical protein
MTTTDPVTLVPVRVTAVPPSVDPLEGLMDAMVRAGVTGVGAVGLLPGHAAAHHEAARTATRRQYRANDVPLQNRIMISKSSIAYARAAGYPLNPGLTSEGFVRPGSRGLKPARSIPAHPQHK